MKEYKDTILLSLAEYQADINAWKGKAITVTLDGNEPVEVDEETMRMMEEQNNEQ